MKTNKVKKALEKLKHMEIELDEMNSALLKFSRFFEQLDNPARTLMLDWKKEHLASCPELRERVIAAQQLNLNVMLVADASGVQAFYVSKPKMPVLDEN